MKKKTFCFILTAISILIAMTITVSGTENAEIAINIKNFPDDAFRSYVQTLDKDTSGTLSPAEIAEVENLIIYDRGISDLTGIEYFTNVKYLNCSTNNLTSLDLSKNTLIDLLMCDSNQLTSLDLSNNTALESIFCGSNKIKKLDFSKNALITSVDCRNGDLEELAFGEITSVQFLYCQNNELTELDISSLTNLKYFRCNDNNLTSIDLSNNPLLVNFYCGNNSLTSVDFAENITIASNKVFSDGNTAQISTPCNGEIDVSGFGNTAQMKIISGGTLNGNILTVSESASQVVYEYSVKCKGSETDSSNDHIMTVTLDAVKQEHNLINIDIDENNHISECTNDGCNYEKSEAHEFNCEVADEKYKVNDASCTAFATYLKSCVCGHASSETFTFDSPLNHDFENGSWICTNPNGHYRMCSRCSAIDTANMTPHEHGVWSDYEFDEEDNSFNSTRACDICGYAHQKSFVSGNIITLSEFIELVFGKLLDFFKLIII